MTENLEKSGPRMIMTLAGWWLCPTCGSYLPSSSALLRHEANNHSLAANDISNESNDTIQNFESSPKNKQKRQSRIKSPKKVQKRGKGETTAGNSQELLKCSDCPYSTHHISNFSRHRSIHTGIKKYKCEQCDFRANAPWEIRLHVDIVHLKVKRFKCEHCNFATASKSQLRQHLLIHSNAKPFKCIYCKYKTSNKGNLARHKACHEKQMLELNETEVAS